MSEKQCIHVAVCFGTSWCLKYSNRVPDYSLPAKNKKQCVCKYICESILLNCFYAHLTLGVHTFACWEVAGRFPRVCVLADALVCNQWGGGMGRLLSSRWQIARGRKEGSEAVHCCPLGRGSHPSSWGSALPVASQPLRKCASCFWGFIGLITLV